MGDRTIRTYFINGRGDGAMGNTWSSVDATPPGRQEIWEAAWPDRTRALDRAASLRARRAVRASRLRGWVEAANPSR
jgi:hypothetical protein